MFRHHFTDAIQSSIAGDSSGNNNSNNTSSYNTYEKSKILAWLSPIEPWTWHEDIRTRRVDGVGAWLLETEEYMNWLGGIRGGGESDGSALFCYGGPWAGKTYIR